MKNSVLDLFYKNVNRFHDKWAVVCGDKKITYKELDELSNNIADALINKGVKKGDFVVLYTEKSIEMIGAIFASLKLGTTYVPIDIRYPEDRIKYMISDCRPTVVFTYHTHINIDNVIIFDLENYKKVDKKYTYHGDSENIDYCIYTSGTTGKPKGVLIKDKSIVNLAESYYDIYGIVQDDVLLQFASIAFDQSVWDIFTILTVGGTLCILPQNLVDDIEQAENYIVENKVTVAAFTPAYLRELNPVKLTTMRVVESGGAAVEKEVVQNWKKHCRVFNTYGPTEACVNALSYELGEEIPAIIPIGKPIHNMNAYIVNDLKECKVGEVGELCLSGIGLSVGYLNNEELTNQKFIDNPFGKGKLYRTGDLAKKLEDGNIICVGRKDNQLKIRAFRVDTGEIESVMSNYGQSAIGVEENQLGDKMLIGYIVSDIDQDVLIKNMQKFLPDYMIPSKIIYLDSMPLTINGKIDYQKLHNYYLKSIYNESYIEPISKFQKIASDIFGSILKIEKYGVNLNFIECGGNSINAIRISSLLRKQGYKVTVGDILSTKNIIELEILINSKEAIDKNEIFDDINLKKDLEKLVHRKIKNYSKLTPTQMYMYKAYKQGIVGDNFLQYLYKINYQYDYRILVDAINLLPIEYDSLTSNFIEFNDEVYQVTFTKSNIEIIEVELDNMEQVYAYMKKDVVAGFDFEHGSLIRLVVFKLPDNVNKLLISVSHMIVDGWSMDNILKTFSRYYMQLLHGISRKELISVVKKLKVPSITKYNNIITNRNYEDACNYWEDYFKDSENAILTIAHDEHKNTHEYYDIIDFIREEDTLKIRKFCRKNNLTENSLFELAFAYLNSKEDKRGRKDVLFTKVISGRDIAIDNISNMVGTMINIIPQRIKINNNYFRELNDVNKNNLQNMAYDKMDFYRTKINNRLLMNEISTMIVFCNYYDEEIYGFEYEIDKDQDDIDLSLYVDALTNKYRFYLTCKQSAYTKEKAQRLLSDYIKLVMEIIDECSNSF